MAAVRTPVGNVSDPAVHEAAARAAEDNGELLGWVNNAGVVRLAPAHELSEPHLDEVLGINLRGAIHGVGAALRSFLRSGVAGSIVNISSIHGRAAFPSYCAYDIAKAGVEALTRSVCVDYGAAGIRCNAVAPGAVDTDIVRPGASDPDDPERATTRSMSPLRRISAPSEVADAVAFLLSDVASSISGHVLAVDNGMSAWTFGFPPVLWTVAGANADDHPRM